MSDLLKIIGGIAVIVGLVFIAPVLGALFGAFTGWVLSILMPVWVPTGLSFIGIHVRPDQLVELGAAIGFIGGFFRSHLTTKDKD
jgi:hypothetical protein